MNRVCWKLALREIRGGVHYFSCFFACIALGVAGVSGILGFSENMEREVDVRAKSLLTGDFEVKSHSRLEEATLSAVSGFLGEQASHVWIRELVGMAFVPETGKTQLVEIKAVSPRYPLYGKLNTFPFLPVDTLFDGASVFVDDSLLLRLGLEIGENIQLGDGLFKIRAVIKSEPDRISGAFSLGPRVIMAHNALDGTGLVQPGSRVRYRHIYSLARGENLGQVVDEIRDLINDSRIEVSDYRKSQKRLLRFFEKIVSYMGLLGMVALILGGVGVAVSMGLFIQKKMEQIALLKSLGAPSKTVFNIFLRVILVAAFVGSVTGVLFGLVFQQAFSWLLRGLMPFDTPLSLSWNAVWGGILVGVTTSLLFSIWPLLKVKSVSPSLLLLRDVDRRFKPGTQNPVLTGCVLGVGLVLMVLWQARSLSLGLSFIGILAGAVLLLQLGVYASISLLKKIPEPPSLVLRLGIKNIYRPGNTTKTAVTAIGIMAILIMTIALVKGRILEEIQNDTSKESPAFYFIDIQEDQKQGFVSLAEKMEAKSDTYPVLRGRLHSLNGKAVRNIPIEGRDRGFYLKREYVLTFKREPSRRNEVVDGAWWTEKEFMEESLVSVEEEVAERLGLALGASIEIDIQGKVVRATVSNIRKVDWSGLVPNFFMVFTKGALDRFSPTYISAVSVGSGKDIALQEAVVAEFTNVTAINVRAILTTLTAILNQLSSVIQFLGIITIMMSFIVLMAVLGLTQAYSLKEMIILRTLGATTMVVSKMKTVEYGVLGCISASISLGVSLLLGFVVLHYFMKLSFEVKPLFLAYSFFGILGFTLATGFCNAWFLYKRKKNALFSQ